MSTISAGTTSTTTLIATGDTTGSLVLKTNDTGSGGTTAMTIDTSQNVGIGTSSPAFKLDARGTSVFGDQANCGVYIQTPSATEGRISVGGRSSVISSNMTFYTSDGGANYERMRIDSSGNLLVGTTSNYGGGRLDVACDGTTNAAAVRATSSSFTGAGFIVYADRNTTNSTFKGLAYYNVGANAYKFIVQDSGNVQNTNNSYGSISDIKVKENITDATPKLAGLMQVRVVNYNLIGDTQKQIGVVAQELEQIFPGMIDEEVDRDAEGNDIGTTTKSVKYSVFVPMLIKAIQEQQALITQLTERISALENK